MQMRPFGPVRTMHVKKGHLTFDAGLGLSILRAPRSIALGVVAIYRAAISPVIHSLNGPACRFEPSCSVYARDASAQYGSIRGGAMALWRIARCNPMGGHGYDPVPPSSRLDLTLKD